MIDLRSQLTVVLLGESQTFLMVSHQTELEIQVHIYIYIQTKHLEHIGCKAQIVPSNHVRTQTLMKSQLKLMVG